MKGIGAKIEYSVPADEAAIRYRKATARAERLSGGLVMKYPKWKRVSRHRASKGHDGCFTYNLILCQAQPFVQVGSLEISAMLA